MMNQDALAVQSYCFRGCKDNAETARRVKAIGLNRIELCGVHADFTDESTFDSVIETYRDAGVQIIGIGVQGFKNDPATEEKYFRFMRKIGAKVMSVSFDPKVVPAAFRAAETLAEKYDVNLAIHNHGGRHWLGGAEMLDAVFAQTSPRIGLMLDTAWALDAGEDPVAMAERFADRLYGVHLKDFTFDRARKHRDVVVGTGNLDLPALFAQLNQAGFDGQAIVEYEADVDNPVPALSKCVAAIQKEMRA
ncbi:MAG: sugar phosphate isomerase/epimerase [Phycisphaerae bacterium]|nr:sugar phosphate isomerase/epimerase [Phycisphaerae bacterium]